MVTYMYTQFLCLHLLLRLVGSSLERFRPQPRTPKCRFCDSSNSQSTVDDYTDCSGSSKFLKVDWIASVSVRHVWAMSLVRVSSYFSRLRHACKASRRHEACCEGLGVMDGNHGYSYFLRPNLSAAGFHQDDLLSGTKRH